jgi:hypothetical protein
MSSNKVFTWHVVGSRGLSGGMILGVDDSLYEVPEFNDGIYFIRMLVKDKLTGFVWNLVFCLWTSSEQRQKSFYY